MMQIAITGHAEVFTTWQLILAVQQADVVTSYFILQLAGEDLGSAVIIDDCDDEFKVMANQFKHLSITGQGGQL